GCKHHDFAIRGNSIHSPIEARGNEHSSSAIKGDPSRVHDVTRKVFDRSVAIDSIDGYRNMFTARTGSRHVKSAVTWIERGIGNYVKAACQLPPDDAASCAKDRGA